MEMLLEFNTESDKLYTVQVGIGVILHRHFRSRHLINLLHNLGCSVSYSEICNSGHWICAVCVRQCRSQHSNCGWTWNFSCDGRSAVHDTIFSCSDEFSCSMNEDSTYDKCCWKVWLHHNCHLHPTCHLRQVQEPWVNRLVMEDVLSLKLRPMDAEIGTTYHWIWMAGPKPAEEPHTGWSGFMEIAAGKRSYEKSVVIPLPFANLQLSNPTSINSCLRFTAENAGSGNKGVLQCLLNHF
ncbi:hypothetical protein PR048_020148 [Dryococelus australis]|uniref:Uncharacterized protein n=1 Tax=Dryococelus australis TaxID=614101 RepID=A0ABQ9H5G9_9NEOP|nr:hypothetical protein PR048_020148 [Dryococelus australis]